MILRTCTTFVDWVDSGDTITNVKDNATASTCSHQREEGRVTHKETRHLVNLKEHLRDMECMTSFTTKEVYFGNYTMHTGGHSSKHFTLTDGLDMYAPLWFSRD